MKDAKQAAKQPAWCQNSKLLRARGHLVKLVGFPLFPSPLTAPSPSPLQHLHAAHALEPRCNVGDAHFLPPSGGRRPSEESSLWLLTSALTHTHVGDAHARTCGCQGGGRPPQHIVGRALPNLSTSWFLHRPRKMSFRVGGSAPHINKHLPKWSHLPVRADLA